MNATLQTRGLLVVGVVLVIGTFFPSALETLDRAVSFVSGLVSINGGLSRREPGQESSGDGSRSWRKLEPFRLNRSFEGGLYGGLVGGLVAGAIIGPLYYVTARDTYYVLAGETISTPSAIIWQIVIYAAVAGMLFGSLSRVGVMWFRHLAETGGYERVFFNEVSSSLLAGLVSGIVVGGLGGTFFGPRYSNIPDSQLLVAGITVGGVFVILGSMFFDFQGKWTNVLRALIFGVVASTLAVAVGLVLLVLNWQAYEELLRSSESSDLAKGGALIGLLAGVALGLQVDVTTLLYRLREEVLWY